MVVSPNRLGLFGGTFDPPHLGHVAALVAAWRTGDFDRLLVTVAGDPYRKSAERPIAPAEERWAMATAAFGDLDGVVISDVEIRREGPSYSIDTVRELLNDGWMVELLVGADAAVSLDSWHEAHDLSRLVSVGIFPRDDTPVVLSDDWRVRFIDMEPVDLSSTWIRERQWSDDDVAKLLPAGVIPLFRKAAR